MVARIRRRKKKKHQPEDDPVESHNIAVLFDMDGTIFRAPDVRLKSHAATIVALGGTLPVSHEKTYQIGITLEESVSYWMRVGGITEERRDEYRRTYFEIENAYIEALEPRDLFMPGAFELLEKLHACEFPMGLVTSCKRSYTEFLLNKTSGTHFFAVTVAREDVEQLKPNPEGFRKAMHELEAIPEHTVIIGDSDGDALAGRALGASVIGVDHGYSNEYELRWASHTVVRDLSDTVRMMQLISLFTHPKYYSDEERTMILGASRVLPHHP